MNKKTIILAFVIRMIVILIGEYQKSITGLEYADLDYKVYTDGARYAMQGQSPMMRHTYRYTPLLSYLMIPNIYYFSFGKILFSLSDIYCSHLIDKILELQGLEPSSYLIWLFNPLVINISTRGNADTIIAMMTLLVLYHILRKNFVTAGIWFGLVVHFKIYPILYAIPIYFFIERE